MDFYSEDKSVKTKTVVCKTIVPTYMSQFNYTPLFMIVPLKLNVHSVKWWRVEASSVKFDYIMNTRNTLI